MKTNRKIFTLVSLLVLASMVLAACGGGATATEAPATEMPATEAPATEMPATEMPATEAPETEAPTEAPVAGEIDCKGAQSGDEISMLYQWSGVEEEKLNQVLQPLIDACGIVLRPESSRDQAL